MKPLLTVIVPCYNVEKQIDKSIKSIVEQTYSELEIVLIDDGSSDSTGDICDLWQKRDHRIKVIHKQNEGLAYARKTGIENATANFITFVDADDWIDLNMYKNMMNALLTTNSDITLCDLALVYENGEIEYRTQKKYTNSIKILGHDEGVILILQDLWQTSFSTKIFKKELFNDVIFPKGRNYGEDLIIHHLFHNATQSVLIDNAFYFYFQRSGSITQQGNIKEELKKISENSDAFYERYSFVKQFPQYNRALPFVAYMTTHIGISLVRNMIAFPQHFSNEYFKLKAEQLRSIPFKEYRNRLKRKPKIEMFMLKFSRRSYKFIIKTFLVIITLTNKLKITNQQIGWFLKDENFW